MLKMGQFIKKKVTKLGSRKLDICPEVTKIGSIKNRAAGL